MRVRAPKPTRTFLEMDELVALLDAAAAQDPVCAVVGASADAWRTPARRRAARRGPAADRDRA